MEAALKYGSPHMGAQRAGSAAQNLLPWLEKVLGAQSQGPQGLGSGSPKNGGEQCPVVIFKGLEGIKAVHQGCPIREEQIKMEPHRRGM